MTRPDTEAPSAPEQGTRRSGPRGRLAPPLPPRAYRRRRGRAWALLALSLVMLIMGMALPQGLLLASGLVTAGIATHLLAPPDHPDRPDAPHHLDRVDAPLHLDRVGRPDNSDRAGHLDRPDRSGSAPTRP
ncbi:MULTISPECIES: hypothetical protein [Streptomyces]|uniref:Uncharacterized protein n=1 Tax=Streptomyces stelliscabiei TaxID=146820 RepID=A0A8I0P7W8_9ACTN|nr:MULTISPECIES: hypothetical protein [Streptomyces]MBE1596883.1 hypothetical protein [Streptomyces stelliscabiei]MDX2514814.1 hypothetical protein [Streptomyces stelliscabiei]SOD77714.1 hypothetical protein SAMN06272781_5604 [Streptomyces sp. 1222.2]